MFNLNTLLEKNALIGTIRDHLRTVHPRLDCRSVRRGALQTFAALPNVTHSMVLQYSKHTDLQMLRRYLRYGKEKSEDSVKAIPHTTAMWP